MSALLSSPNLYERMHTILGFFCLLGLFFSSVSEGEPLRVKKNRSRSKTSSSRPSGLARTSMTVQVQTPAIREDLFNRRFQSFGPLFSISFPITQLDKRTYLHGEAGLGLTYSKLELSNPNTEFAHLEFPIPVLLRLMHALGSRITGEIFAGAWLRPFFYDSRDNTSGGFQTLKEDWILADAGLGLRVFLAPSTRLRFRASYLSLSLGLEFLL